MMDIKYIKILFSFALLFLATMLLGQQGKNPFDIGSRKQKNIEQSIKESIESQPTIEIPNEELVVDSIEIETTPPAEVNSPRIINDSENPFDIERLQTIKKSKVPPKEKSR